MQLVIITVLFKYNATFYSSCAISLLYRNMQAFNAMIMGSTPRFKIDAILSAPKVVLQPRSIEIYLLAMQCIKHCVESTKVETLPIIIIYISILQKYFRNLTPIIFCVLVSKAICALDARDLH